jgi:hypothetical protein
MMKTANYLQKYIGTGIAGRAQRYIDKHYDGAWTRLVDSCYSMLSRAASIEEMKAVDEYNFEHTKKFMEAYFQSPEYVAELEREAEDMISGPCKTTALLVRGMVLETMKGME